MLDTPPDQRTALIARLSGGDPARRVALERLRVECEREPALLTRPAAERFADLFADDAGDFPAALTERYQPARVVGRGGMATVYLAHDVKHGRDVAIKVLDASLATLLGPKRFLREIEIVAQLHHPHIVPLYDSGEAGGHLYYVMPYQPDASLRQKLEREGALPVDEAVRILRDVCDALAHAHAQGIIHRDIKPDNVLLTERHALVTDFGVAKASTVDATATGITLGTPAYMAPEQIAADPQIDHRADIYAVGVLGYELLTGRPPFTEDTAQQTLTAHLTQPPEPIATIRPQVPPALAALITKCLQKPPADRWQTVDEMLEQLQALPIGHARSRRLWPRAAVALVGLAVVGALVWGGRAAPTASWRERWSNARIERLTDYPGSEVDAAISRDGRLVAFLADRAEVFDAFVGLVGTGQFTDLTRGRLPQLYNEGVRNIGFSADAGHVWVRVADFASPASVSLVPTQGGPLQPFLGTAVMAVWSPDGARVAYHETTPGDPIYVANADGAKPQRLFAGDAGVHSHYLAWSPDGQWLYFSHGVPPDGMDIWRIPARMGARAERITHHNSRVAYPVLLDNRTLLYTATADDGTGPWLYAMDLNQRVPHRWSTGVEHYLSIAASAEQPGRPRRLVATVSNPTVDLWSFPITPGIVEQSEVARMALPTSRAAAPRFASDTSLFYLATRGGADGIWQHSRGAAAELWRPREGAVVGAVAISLDGRRMCVPVRRQSRSTLYCSDADGTAPRALAESLDVRGAASWSPDGKWIAMGAMEGTGVRVFKIPIDGGKPVRLVDSVSFNPVWSPDGRMILYSGTSRARSVPLRAVTPDGQPVPLPSLVVDRVGDSYRFLPGGRQLTVKLGGFRRQDFWLVDLTTGERRQLTRLRPGASLDRFDVSPDGRRVVFEQARENSDVVLIELPAR